jgi:hypothetical protein
MSHEPNFSTVPNSSHLCTGAGSLTLGKRRCVAPTTAHPSGKETYLSARAAKVGTPSILFRFVVGDLTGSIARVDPIGAAV